MKHLHWWLVSPKISLGILNHISDRIPAAAIVRDRFALAGLQMGDSPIGVPMTVFLCGGLPGQGEIRGIDDRAGFPTPCLVHVRGVNRLKNFLAPTRKVAEFP